MTIVEIQVHPDDAPDTARKLLAAAGDHRDVTTGGLSAFYVPEELAAAAGFGAQEETPTQTPAAGAKRGNQGKGEQDKSDQG